MKKHILNLSIIAITVVLYTISIVACQNVETQPTPQNEEIAEFIDDDNEDNDGTRKQAIENPIYFRVKVKEPTYNDYDQSHTVWYIHTELAEAYTAKSFDYQEVFTLAELKALRAANPSICGSFRVSQANGGKIVAKKLEYITTTFLLYDPLKKKAFVAVNPTNPNVFLTGGKYNYTEQLFTINWNNRPQGF